MGGKDDNTRGMGQAEKVAQPAANGKVLKYDFITNQEVLKSHRFSGDVAFGKKKFVIPEYSPPKFISLNRRAKRCFKNISKIKFDWLPATRCSQVVYIDHASLNKGAESARNVQSVDLRSRSRTQPMNLPLR